FVVLESLSSFFLQWREFLFHLRHTVEQRAKTFADERDCTLRLLNRGLGMNAWWMLQIRLRLFDHEGDGFHALAQIRNALLRRVEIARHEKVKAVGQAL